jgi:hypothetical protein
MPPQTITFTTAANNDTSSTSIDPVAWIIPLCIFIFFVITPLIIHLSFKALGRYRRRKGYPYKYRFDVVPMGHKWLKAGTVVFQVKQDMWGGYKMVPLKVPGEGVMMVIKAEDEENGKDGVKEVEVA